MENVTLYDGGITRAEVEEAIDVVGVQGLVDQLPGGLDYDVIERGVMLSTGQRQLMSFVRAYAQKPRILVLDEATSSVDPESDQMIQSATEKLTKGRTSVMVAHRLSTIRHADRIMVLDQGRLIQSGSHDALMGVEGMYKDLVLSQVETD